MGHHWQVLSYTKKGGTELDSAMFLALSEDGTNWNAVHCGTAVLFPKADLERGPISGTTRILKAPYIFRTEEDTFGIVAECYDADGTTVPGCENQVLLFESEDLTDFRELGMVEVTLPGERAYKPMCRWMPGMDQYEISCVTETGSVYAVYSQDLTDFSLPVKSERIEWKTPEVPEGWIAGNVLPISALEAKTIADRLNPLTADTVELEESYKKEELPENVAIRYNDGSKEYFPVAWGEEFKEESIHYIKGTIHAKQWAFPFLADRADPMICKFKNRYYFMATDDEGGQLTLKIRGADTVEELKTAEEHIIFTANKTGSMSGCIWAPELHEINGKCFVFFAAGNPYWYTVQSYVMRCKGGDLLCAENWGKPHRVRRSDGSVLNPVGITLDMTAEVVNGEAYVVWAQRIMSPKGEHGEHGTSDLMIARTDMEHPWLLESEPVCLCRPDFGWDRIDATVDEGPFFIRHEDDIFVTFSGASVSVYYCVGMLKIKENQDLLDPNAWKKIAYPILKTENVEGQHGPGHNAYVKDLDGKDLVIFHAKTPPEKGIDAGMVNRNCGIRNVHWDIDGNPRLDMTPERFVPENMKEIVVKLK